MSVPGRNPMVGQTPGFVSRHCRFLHLTGKSFTIT
jgi:hypothetical protein